MCAAWPAWVHGSIDGLYGCVTVFNHRNRRRYTDLYPDADSFAPRPGRMIGTLGPVPGIVGSIQALEAIKVLTGCDECLDGCLLMLELDRMSFTTIDF